MAGRTQIFAKRLRELCDKKPSYTQVANDLGINRQQLSRYLAGDSMPRDGLLNAFAAYFGVSVEHLLSENSAVLREENTYATDIAKFFAGQRYEEITPEELDVGFYKQYKKSLVIKDHYLITLAHIKKVGSSLRYKRRTSAYFLKQNMSGDVQNTFEGVFFKQGANIAMIDSGTAIGELTFHVLETSHLFDRSIKPGVHLTISSFNMRKTNMAPFILQKLPDTECPLSFARNQGFYSIEKLPEEVRHFFE